MKLTVIGGGGVRSMFLAKSIAQRAHDLHITELVFMDCDADKLRIYGGLARHVARLLDPALKFTLTTDADEAVRDADYIITTIRVGGDTHPRARRAHRAGPGYPGPGDHGRCRPVVCYALGARPGGLLRAHQASVQAHGQGL